MSKDAPEYFAVGAEERSIAIIAARYNSELVDALLESVIETLLASGAQEENIEVHRIPGANEAPYVASMLGRIGTFDVIIALGVVIQGKTDHHEIIAQSTGNALQTAAMQFQVPVINGIITVKNREQAEERVRGDYQRGVDFARAALEMAQVSEKLEDRILEEAVDLTDEDIEALIDWDDEDLDK